MSKSLERVMAALAGAKMGAIAIEMPSETRTSDQAADAVGCAADQIVKSIIFSGAKSGALYLFVAAGSNQVDPVKAAIIAGEPLGRADPKTVRDTTGFAIGGVSPVGHFTQIKAFFDPHLLTFGIVYAAAGTPRHIFAIDPTDLMNVSGAVEADFVT